MFDFLKGMLGKKAELANEEVPIVEIEPQVQRMNVVVAENVKEDRTEERTLEESENSMVVFQGKEYNSEQALAEAYNVTFAAYISRLSRGWNQEEALGIVERIPEEKGISNNIFMVADMMPGIRNVFDKNIYCILGIAADSNVEQIIQYKKMIEDLENDNTTKYKPIIELPFIEGVLRDTEHLNNALEFVASHGLLYDKWLWFKNDTFIPFWNRKILDKLKMNTCDYDLLLTCYYHMLITDPEFVEEKKWNKVLSFLDRLFQKEDAELFEIISEHLNVVDLNLFSQKTIVHSFRNAILQPLKDNIEACNAEDILSIIKYWKASKKSFACDMQNLCDEAVFKWLHDKSVLTAQYCEKLSDDTELILSDSELLKEKMTCLVSGMDEMLPFLEEEFPDIIEVERSVNDIKSGLWKIGDILLINDYDEIAALLFLNIYMLCDKKEKRWIKTNVPIIYLVDLPIDELDSFERYELADIYDEKKDYEHALKWYQSLEGSIFDSRAKYILGTYYENGYAVNKNVRKAYELYIAAAEGGNRESMVTLANEYYHGSSNVNKNLEKAEEYWIYLFIYTPLPFLKKRLDMYFPNWRIEENRAYNRMSIKKREALEEFAGMGIAAAAYWLGAHYYGELSSSPLYGYKEDREIARRWYLEAALKDYAPSIRALEEKYEITIDDTTDGEEMLQISLRYYKSTSEQERDLFFYWLRKAVDNGCERACNLLGTCYDEAIGTSCDYEKANELYLRAINNDRNPGAYYNYAINCYYGAGCRKNRSRAKEYLKLACENGSSSAEKFLKDYYGIDYSEKARLKISSGYSRPWYYSPNSCSECMLESFFSNDCNEDILIYDCNGLSIKFGGYEVNDGNVYLMICTNNHSGYLCHVWLEEIVVNGEYLSHHTEVEDCEADYGWHCHSVLIENADADYYNDVEFTASMSNQNGEIVGQSKRVKAQISCPDNEISVQILEESNTYVVSLGDLVNN